MLFVVVGFLLCLCLLGAALSRGLERGRFRASLPFLLPVVLMGGCFGALSVPPSPEAVYAQMFDEKPSPDVTIIQGLGEGGWSDGYYGYLRFSADPSTVNRLIKTLRLKPRQNLGDGLPGRHWVKVSPDVLWFERHGEEKGQSFRNETRNLAYDAKSRLVQFSLSAID
jgi:hypothetical protein